ncbi:MAG TPA: hypothetical protein VF168_13225 [Trueperaceae bacterium]
MISDYTMFKLATARVNDLLAHANRQGLVRGRRRQRCAAVPKEAEGGPRPAGAAK